MPQKPGELRAGTIRSLPIADRNGAVVVFSIPLDAGALPESLTGAERDVAQRMLAGDSNRQIAAARGTSERTVHRQATEIFRKAGVNSRAELAAEYG